MKIKLLLIALAITFAGNSQSLTQANEAAIGENVTMYVCDSMDAYAATQGTGVVWDYSTLVGITGQTRIIGIHDPSTSINASSFPTSTFEISAGTLFSSFYTSTATERMSQGFVFNGLLLGEVVAIFNVDEAKVMDYPFSNGSTLVDSFEGQLNYALSGTPQTSAITGNIHTSVDGQGTLILPGSTSFTDVIRYKTIDSTYANVFLVGDIVIIRNQYEYYDLANTNLPVFTHTSLVAQGIGSTTPFSSQTRILSSIEADNFLTINEVKTIEFDVYPNPATNEITLHGDFSSNAVATIYDQSGRIISSHILSNGNNLNVSSLEAGIYIVHVQTAGFIAKKTVIIQ